MKVLKGHESPETAFMVNDYPYGFRLRCSIRYWLETDKKKGVRFCSQTTNPKKAVIFWNKPKKSTYCRFGGAMYLDGLNHVQWCGVNEYSNHEECSKFLEIYRDGIPAEIMPELNRWIEAKEIYERRVHNGMDWLEAGRKTALEMAAKSLGFTLSLENKLNV